MRTLQQIRDEIKNTVQTDSVLGSLLTSTSQFSIYRLWINVVATAIYTHEVVFEVAKKKIEDILSKNKPGILAWYQEQAFKFQFGHSLSWSGVDFSYSNIDESAKIVKFCSVIEQGNVIIFKVAKANSSGLPTELSPTEITSLTAYLNQVKFAGVYVNAQSYAADDLKIEADIFFDPIMPVAQVSAMVETAINNYIKNLPFNGVLSRIGLEDAIQTVKEVKDIRIVDVQAKYGSNPFVSIPVHYLSNAGYLSIDTNYPLTSTLNYVPYPY